MCLFAWWNVYFIFGFFTWLWNAFSVTRAICVLRVLFQRSLSRLVPRLLQLVPPSSRSFPGSEVMLRFPLAYAKGCRLRVVLSLPQHLRCPHSPPQMRSGRKVGPPLKNGWSGNCHKISERLLCFKLECSPWSRSRFSTLLIVSVHFTSLNAQLIPLDKPITPVRFTVNIFGSRGYHKMRCCDCICIEGMYWVYSISRHAAITTAEKERLLLRS